MGLENLYEKYPWLNKPSYHLMEKLGIVGPWGESGWLTKKLPDMMQSYENVVDPAVDFGKKLGNIGGEFWEMGSQGVEAAGDLIYDTTKWGPGGQEPQGFGSIKTSIMDAAGPYLGYPEGSGMEGDAIKLIQSFVPPEDYTNLDSWDMYQYWKDGSGWDSADARKIDKKVKKEMEKVDFSTDALWGSFRDLANQPGQEYLAESDDAIRYYYPQYVQMEKDFARSAFRDEFEFMDTGENYGKWASQEYQNTLLNKYGKYPVMENLTEMSANISPYGDYEGLTSTFNRANEDYINALKKGESGMKPTEWDYGLFDDDASVGITKEMEPWFDYSTKEAEEFYEAPQALIPEILIGGSGLLKAPKLLKYAQGPLQGTKAGRIAREFAPGLFQWGKRDKFGIPKFEKDKGWRKFINRSTGVIDFARPKGLQFGAAATVSELMDRD
tara:strand:+ start:38 stop:1357 length:1320 start_codon:yes stop_codon:yes gene_type:complete